MIRLRTEILILAPVARCFDLARSVDLHQDAAEPIDGRAVAGRVTGLSELADCTTWLARFFGLRFSLTTCITRFEAPYDLSDVQCRGLLTHFGHDYAFHALSPRQTMMTDDFFFQSPLGMLGAASDRLVLRRKMRHVARWRVSFLRRVAESEEWRRYLPVLPGD
jgi:ligand-binding SRPBCC domain-containing protein